MNIMKNSKHNSTPIKREKKANEGNAMQETKSGKETPTSNSRPGTTQSILEEKEKIMRKKIHEFKKKIWKLRMEWEESNDIPDSYFQKKIQKSDHNEISLDNLPPSNVVASEAAKILKNKLNDAKYERTKKCDLLYVDESRNKATKESPIKAVASPAPKKKITFPEYVLRFDEMMKQKYRNGGVSKEYINDFLKKKVPISDRPLKQAT